MELTDRDRIMLEGAHGPAVAMAMRLVSGLGEAVGAHRLIDISAAHIDGALYVGRASLDFAAKMRDLGGRVAVRTTLNVSSLDLLHPELIRTDDETRTAARSTMQAYEDMGCTPTWTCAPYQLAERPQVGDRVAWAESNAVVFANSVLGAHTERFGDFIDIAAAVTGRVPEFGMYLSENRAGGVRYDVSAIPEEVRTTEHFFALLGLLIGADAGRSVPVITGIDQASEDQLKIMGAAAATSGAVALIHVVGVTPEAATLPTATGGADIRRRDVTMDALRQTRRRLATAAGRTRLRSVSVGTPHYSREQIARLAELLDGRSIHESIRFYVNTGRDVLAACPDAQELTALGVIFVTDTCTYLTPILEVDDGVAMTDSAKWAYYAPGNIGVEAVFGSVYDCVESAVAGAVVHDDRSWT